jgi:hypothetical protein
MSHLLKSWSKNKDMLICSMATSARHIELLNIMAPTVAVYAHIHQMDSLIIPMHGERLCSSRPENWDKIILLNHMLNFYDTVVWLDCDCVICNPFVNIRAAMYQNYPMYLTRQQWGGFVNTGVWVLRSSQLTKDILESIWNNTKFIYHPLLEQGALMDLIGYRFERLDQVTYHPTPLGHQIGHLDKVWNSCSCEVTDATIIKHYCGPKTDLVCQCMRQDRDQFMQKVGG